jgi:hypothetical protein
MPEILSTEYMIELDAPDRGRFANRTGRDDHLIGLERSDPIRSTPRSNTHVNVGSGYLVTQPVQEFLIRRVGE